MVKDNIEEIRRRIVSVCAKMKRDPRTITVVAVSKGRSLEQINQVLEEGITDIGENKVQEALLKHNSLPTVKWHMVGHLQSNKTKEAVAIFDLIQSVDSLHLADKINKEAARINKVQDVLIEIKTSPEATKSGFKQDDAVEAVKKISELKNINIKGFMTIAPIADNPQKARPYFRMLRELRDRMLLQRTTNAELTTLSMGMTDDFEVAIEEGSTMLRLGRAIFEG